MAQRGKPSTAHQYDKSGACIHCGMYRTAVEQMQHVCKPWREALEDRKGEEKVEEKRGQRYN